MNLNLPEVALQRVGKHVNSGQEHAIVLLPVMEEKFAQEVTLISRIAQQYAAQVNNRILSTFSS